MVDVKRAFMKLKVFVARTISPIEMSAIGSLELVLDKWH